jgi:hypothetical protein
MNNSITWVKASKDYHSKTDEQLVPFCSGLSNQLAIDPDVSAAGIPAPLTIISYTGNISDLNTDLVARQTSRAASLTSDELNKAGILLHNTDILVNFIDNLCNQKFPGNVSHITTVFARFGLLPVEHGGGHKHIFRILQVAGGNSTIESPSGGPGTLYHWRWSIDTINWKQVKSTHKSTVTIHNLPQDTRVYFQYDTSPAVGRGTYPLVSANADDYHWSSSISEIIPASTTTGN